MDLFFTLSGFILTYIYLETFRRLSFRSYLQFLGFRLARIYPVHVFTIAVLLAALAVNAARGGTLNHPENYTFSELVRHLLLLHAWAEVTPSTWNYPSWAISAVWSAYVVFPFLAVAVARVGSRRVAFIGAAAAISAQLLVAPAVGLDQDELAPLRISGEFLMGCFLARAYLFDPSTGRRWSLAAAASMVFAVVLMTLIPVESGGRKYVIPIFGMIVFALARAGAGPTAWLGSGFVVFLGEAAYSLYMTHGVVEVVGAKVFPMEAYADATLIAKVAVLVAYALVVAGAAAATYVAVERPARSALRGIILRRRMRPEAPSVAALPAPRTGSETATDR